MVGMVLKVKMIGMARMDREVPMGGATGPVRVLDNPVYIKAALRCQGRRENG